jgi:tetratricopeptide (TPR) repeat protein
MYLKGGKWTMLRKTRKPSSPWTILFLLALILAVGYLNTVVVPTLPGQLQPTLTPTRNPESFVAEAEQAFGDGKLSQAIESYKAAILTDPTNPATFVALARVQMFAGQYHDALDSAEKAIVLNPDYSLAYAYKAWSLDFLGKLGDAKIAIEEALKLDPNNAYAYAFYAEILVDSGYENIEKAGDASRKAQQLAPNLIETHRARGYVLWNAGSAENLALAVQEFEAAIALNDKLWNLHYTLGLIYQSMGDYESADTAMSRAFALNPTNPDIPTDLYRNALAIGQFGQAVQYAEQAVALAPERANLRGNLGAALYKQGEYERSAREFGLAIHGGTTSDGVQVQGLPLQQGKAAEYYSLYGLTLVKLSRCDEAVPIFQKVLQLIPEDQIPYQNALIGIESCQTGTPVP